MNIENGWKAIDRFLKILSGRGVVGVSADADTGQDTPAGGGDAGGMFEGYKAPEAEKPAFASSKYFPTLATTWLSAIPKRSKLIIDIHFRLKWEERWDDEVAILLPRLSWKELASRDVGGLYGSELLTVLDWFSSEWGDPSFPLGRLLRRGIQDVIILEGDQKKDTRVRIDIGASEPVLYEKTFDTKSQWFPFLDGTSPLEFTPKGQELWGQIQNRSLFAYKIEEDFLRMFGILTNIDSKWKSHVPGETVRFPINITSHIYHNYRLDKSAEMKAAYWSSYILSKLWKNLIIVNILQSIPGLKNYMNLPRVGKKTSSDKWLEGWYWAKKTGVSGW